MKRLLSALFAITLILSLVGCKGNTENTEPTEPTTAAPTAPPDAPVLDSLPEEMAGEYVCFDISGNWGTYITLAADGTFTGRYVYSSPTETGDNYENGTVHLSEFSGEFTEIQQIDSYSYSLNLPMLTLDNYNDSERIEDGIRYVVETSPVGMDGNRFILYRPETPIEGIAEEFLAWWPLQYSIDATDTLDRYAIRNVKTGHGYFTAEQFD